MASCLIEIKVKNENKWFWNYIEIQIVTAQKKNVSESAGSLWKIISSRCGLETNIFLRSTLKLYCLIVSFSVNHEF